MNYQINFSKIPILSWIGVRNPNRASILSCHNEPFGCIKKLNATRVTMSLNQADNIRELVAVKKGSSFEIVDSRNSSLVTAVFYQIRNAIEITEPPLGEMDNFGFGCWSNSWGEIRTSSFRTSIAVNIKDENRVGEIMMIAYLSYSNMSRIGH